jgi:hypothetical protein
MSRSTKISIAIMPKMTTPAVLICDLMLGYFYIKEYVYQELGYDTTNYRTSTARISVMTVT